MAPQTFKEAGIPKITTRCLYKAGIFTPSELVQEDPFILLDVAGINLHNIKEIIESCGDNNACN